MEMNQERLIYLIDRLVSKTISAAEKEELRVLLNTHPDADLAENGVASWLNERMPIQQQYQEDIERQSKAILSVYKTEEPLSLPVPGRNVRHIHVLRNWKWAAAVLLFLLGFVYWRNNDRRKIAMQVAKPASMLVHDIAPGGDKAVLTLADGSTIRLDSAANGSLAKQGNVSVVKLANGQLAYQATGNKPNGNVFNTMRTPRGGQYQLLLPDGTKVWLNAASTITFPVAFVEKSREVTVTGEVYFEVAKNIQQPFIVEVGHETKVEVLGTSFNVNAYDSSSIQATLLEGAVRVRSSVAGSLLRPGQQALVNTGNASGKIGVKMVNTEKVMAWKNGMFNFDDADLPTVIKELERWYNIEIVCEKNVPDIRFGGEMNRNIQLSGALKVLEDAGVHYKMEQDRRLIIMP
jgi:ferric-dicitrate binding protein FerR (iron transport regulator)